MTQSTITLHIEVSGQITADFGASDQANKVHALFGTYRLPTPWTFHRVPNVEEFGAYVISTIRKNNPNDTVEWSNERCQEFTAFRFCNDTLRELRA